MQSGVVRLLGKGAGRYHPQAHTPAWGVVLRCCPCCHVRRPKNRPARFVSRDHQQTLIQPDYFAGSLPSGSTVMTAWVPTTDEPGYGVLAYLPLLRANTWSFQGTDFRDFGLRMLRDLRSHQRRITGRLPLWGNPLCGDRWLLRPVSTRSTFYRNGPTVGPRFAG